jgi:Mn-dependent DtxR family transcriptional regulator
MRLRDRILLLLAESAVPVRSSILARRLNVQRSSLWARLVHLERAGKVKKHLRK